MKNKEYWMQWIKAAGIRALKTFAQTAVGMITVGAAIQDIDWLLIGSVSAVAAIASLLTSIVGIPEVEKPDDEILPSDESKGE